MSKSLTNRKLQVAIIGAGVIGLTTAVHLQDRFPEKLDLTLLADKFSPNTVSDKSVAIFWPFLPKDYSQYEDMKRWIFTSFKKFQPIFNSADNAQAGMSLVNGYVFISGPQPDLWCKGLVSDFRHVKMESAEAKTLSVPPDCVEIWTFGTYLINPTPYLQWLMGKAKEGGCKVEKRKISSLDEVTPTYDVVINCTGLGSCKELLSDPCMHPIRGQAVVVKAPWLKHWVVLYEFGAIHTGIFPRGSEVMLVGTREVGEWKEATDPDTLRNIIDRCQDLVPSVRGAEVVGSWAGLRPGRDCVRLEGCEVPGGSLLIHCYGHAGKGVILSWGCASDIGDMVEHKLM